MWHFTGAVNCRCGRERPTQWHMLFECEARVDLELRPPPQEATWRFWLCSPPPRLRLPARCHEDWRAKVAQLAEAIRGWEDPHVVFATDGGSFVDEGVGISSWAVVCVGMDAQGVFTWSPLVAAGIVGGIDPASYLAELVGAVLALRVWGQGTARVDATAWLLMDCTSVLNEVRRIASGGLACP